MGLAHSLRHRPTVPDALRWGIFQSVSHGATAMASVSPTPTGTGGLVKRNYQFEKRQKELEKKRKKELKQQKQRERASLPADDAEAVAPDDSAVDG